MCLLIWYNCVKCKAQRVERIKCERAYAYQLRGSSQLPCGSIRGEDRLVLCSWCKRYQYDRTTKEMVMRAACAIVRGPGLPTHYGLPLSPVSPA